MTLPALLAVGILGDGTIVERSWSRSFRPEATGRRASAVLHWQHGASSGIWRRIGTYQDRRRPKLSHRIYHFCKLGDYTTRLSAKIKSKETTDAIAVTRVSALNVP